MAKDEALALLRPELERTCGEDPWCRFTRADTMELYRLLDTSSCACGEVLAVVHNEALLQAAGAGKSFYQACTGAWLPYSGKDAPNRVPIVLLFLPADEPQQGKPVD